MIIGCFYLLLSFTLYICHLYFGRDVMYMYIYDKRGEIDIQTFITVHIYVLSIDTDLFVHLITT